MGVPFEQGNALLVKPVSPKNMSPEQKTKIDHASEKELWELLSAVSAEGVESIYTRERLVRKTQMETQQKLDDLTLRVKTVEQQLHRSQLGTPTFWLALMAAGFASFSVPWDDVGQTAAVWGKAIRKAIDTPPSKRVYSGDKEQAGRISDFSKDLADHRPVTESDFIRHSQVSTPAPALPDDGATSPLSDALLLLPKLNEL